MRRARRLGLAALLALIASTSFAQTPEPPQPGGPGTRPPGPAGPGHAPRTPDPSTEGGPRRERLPPSPRSLKLAGGPNVVFAAALDGECLSPPAVTATGIAVGTTNGTITLIEPAHGTVLWTARGPGPVVSGPVISGTLVVFATLNGQLVTAAMSDGTLRDRTALGSLVSAPLAADATRVAVAVGSSELRVYRTIGLQLDCTVSGLGTIRVAPVFAGDRLIVGTNDGVVAAFEPARGSASVWRARVDAAVAARPVEFGSATPSILVGSQSGTLVAIDVADGKQRWSVRKPAALNGAAVVENRLVAVFADGSIAELDPNSGADKKRTLLSAKPAFQPLCTTAATFCATASGQVDVLDASLVRRRQIDLGGAPVGGTTLGKDGAIVVVRAGAVYRISP